MVTLVFVYTAMHCGCMPWCLLNIKSVGLWNRVAVRYVKRIELKEILPYFSYFGVRIPFFSYFLATVIPIFLFSKGHLSLDTLQLITLRLYHGHDFSV